MSRTACQPTTSSGRSRSARSLTGRRRWQRDGTSTSSEAARSELANAAGAAWVDAEYGKKFADGRPELAGAGRDLHAAAPYPACTPIRRVSGQRTVWACSESGQRGATSCSHCSTESCPVRSRWRRVADQVRR